MNPNKFRGIKGIKTNDIDIKDDPTLINYLALAAAILDPDPEPNAGSYIKGLYGSKEEIAKNLEYLEATKEERKDMDVYKPVREPYTKAGVMILVTNLETGETQEYNTVRAFAKEKGLNEDSIRQKIRVNKDKPFIEFKGYKIQKIN